MDKKRGKRATNNQMELLVDFIDTNRVMISGKCHPNDMLEVERKWSEVVEQLNEIPNGARKDIKQWKSFYAQWKSVVRKKARKNKKELTETGGGGYISSLLTGLENRLMGLIGWVSVVGCAEMPEELDPSIPIVMLESCTVDHETVTDMHVHDDIVEDIVDDIVEDIVEDLVEDIYELIPECEPKIIIKNIPKRKHKANQKVPVHGHLDNAAKLYAISAEKMAKSVSDMAVSISQMAHSFGELAMAINNIASAVQN